MGLGFGDGFGSCRCHRFRQYITQLREKTILPANRGGVAVRWLPVAVCPSINLSACAICVSLGLFLHWDH